jgi:gas vesicle protein
MRDCDGSTKMVYFLGGLGIGAILALLFAPQSGKQTRDLIVQKAEEGKDYVTTKGRDVVRQAGGMVEKGKETLADALESGKKALQS